MQLNTIEKRFEWDNYYSPTFNWERCNYKELPLNDEFFMEEFKNKFDWYHLCSTIELSLDVIRKYKDYVHWAAICKYQYLTEAFIEEFKNKVNWGFVSHYQLLSYDFIWKFKNKIDWEMILSWKRLSNTFIEKFLKNKTIMLRYTNNGEIITSDVIWRKIAIIQELKEYFVTKYKQYLNPYYILKYQSLSEKYFKQFLLNANIDKNFAKAAILANKKIKLSSEFKSWIKEQY